MFVLFLKILSSFVFYHSVSTRIFSTYPRTYNLINGNGIFSLYQNKYVFSILSPVLYVQRQIVPYVNMFVSKPVGVMQRHSSGDG